MLQEKLAELPLDLRLLLQEPLVDDVADIRRAEVHAELGREAVLQLADVVRLGLVFQLLLPRREEPDAPLEALPELRDEGLELQHPALVLVDVLAHLVDDDEEGPVLGAEMDHRVDGLDDLAYARPRTRTGPGTAVDPARRVAVTARG